MGSSLTHLYSHCLLCSKSCFSEETEEENPGIPLLQISNKSSFTSSTQDISEIPECQINEPHPKQDYFFNLIQKATAEFLSHIQGPFEEEGFAETLKKPNIQVLTKETSSGFVLKSQVTIECDPNAIIDLILDVKNRKTWDENVDKIELVASLQEETTVTYVRYKKFLIVAPRDALMVNRVVRVGDGVGFVSTSCEMEEFPVCDGVVRVRMEVAGYYFEKTGGATKVLGFTKGDVGGKIPKALVKTIAANALPRFISSVQRVINKKVNK